MYVCTYVRPEKKMTKDLPIEFNRSRDKDRDRNKKPSQHQHHRPCMYTFPRPSTPPKKNKKRSLVGPACLCKEHPSKKKKIQQKPKKLKHID